jgi:hypothetical protein
MAPRGNKKGIELKRSLGKCPTCGRNGFSIDPMSLRQRLLAFLKENPNSCCEDLALGLGEDERKVRESMNIIYSKRMVLSNGPKLTTRGTIQTMYSTCE